jgi:hypothetical protein
MQPERRGPRAAPAASQCRVGYRALESRESRCRRFTPTHGISPVPVRGGHLWRVTAIPDFEPPLSVSSRTIWARAVSDAGRSWYGCASTGTPPAHRIAWIASAGAILACSTYPGRPRSSHLESMPHSSSAVCCASAKPSKSVVFGDSKRPDSFFSGSPNQIGRSKTAVRCACMGVQINHERHMGEGLRRSKQNAISATGLGQGKASGNDNLES